jgi:hypothetical protein
MTDNPKIVTFPGWDELDKRFEPYAIQLGWIAYSWNALHDSLGNIFWTLTAIRTGDVPLAIWNAVPNDRTQRGILRAVADVTLREKPQVQKALHWLLAEADKFEDRRNDALHTPFTFNIGPQDSTLVSNSYKGHKRALKLKDKDLLDEFTWYGQSINMLTRYARSINFSLADPTNFAWPADPVMPSRPIKR